MADEIVLWVELDLHQVIRENDRVLIRIRVPEGLSHTQLKAAALRMVSGMKPELFGTEHFVLADVPKTSARVLNAYYDDNGQPIRSEPILNQETDEVEPRIFVPADKRAEGTGGV